MQKNPNFEWKPVSTGNEKFMIVLSWVVVAFVVIIAGLYWGRTSRTPDALIAGSGEVIGSESSVPVGQGNLKAATDTDRTLLRHSLGQKELYTIMLGSGTTDFSRTEAEAKVEEYIAKGYAARAIESDLHNQRFVVFIGRFEEYNAATRTLDEFKGLGVPAGLTVVKREIAATFRQRGDAPKLPAATTPADPIRSVIRNQRGENADTTPATTPTAAGANNTTTPIKTVAVLESSATERLTTIVQNAHAEAGQAVEPVTLNTIARIGKREETETVPAASPAIVEAEDLALTDDEMQRVEASSRAHQGNGKWKLQLATFGTLNYALNYKNRLEKDGFTSVNIKESTSSKTGKTYYQVRIEGFTGKPEAQQYLKDVFEPYDPKIKPLITN